MFPTDRLYQALGTPCSFTQQGASEAISIRAVLDARPADVLGGDQISTRYEIRCEAGPVSGLVRKGARVGVTSNSHEAIRNVLMGCLGALSEDDLPITLDLDDTLWDTQDVIRRADQAMRDWLDAHRPDWQRLGIDGLRKDHHPIAQEIKNGL